MSKFQTITNCRSTPLQQLSLLRRTAGSESIARFAQMYLPAHFQLPSSPMHKQLVKMLHTATRQRGARLAVAAPRGHAKSTLVSLAFVLWCICYRKEQFIVLISNTLAQAIDVLAQIKKELQSNCRLLTDFPEACEQTGATGSIVRWRKEEIVTPSGVRISALGAGNKIRGRRHRQYRPTLIILDDVENEEEVRSPEQRRFKSEWFQRAVLKAGSAETNVFVIGTILHYDALLANLLDKKKSAGWKGHKYQAIQEYASHTEMWDAWQAIYTYLDEHKGRSGPKAAQAFFRSNRKKMLVGTKVLWPELEDYHSLMQMKISDGRFSFDCEKQNEPVNPEDCYFQDSDFHYWDDQYESVEALLEDIAEHGALCGACDPSMGKAGRGYDDSVIVTLLKDYRTDLLYVLDADVRRRRPDAIIQDVITYHRLRQYEIFTMETNQFQEFLADELRRRSNESGAYVPISYINNTSDKLGRIQRLQPIITAGKLRFSRRHVTLLEQLRQFPHAAHDDAPDALEMAVRTSQRLGASQSWGQFNV